MHSTPGSLSFRKRTISDLVVSADAVIQRSNEACLNNAGYVSQSRPCGIVASLNLEMQWFAAGPSIRLHPPYANSSIGSVKPRTGYSPTRSRSKSLLTKSANAQIGRAHV